jgi:hypothetical protein
VVGVVGVFEVAGLAVATSKGTDRHDPGTDSKSEVTHCKESTW